MGATNPSYKAGGNVSPACFVKGDTTTNFQVLQAGAGDVPMGVSSPSVRRFDSSYAAILGDSITVFAQGEICLLTAGSTFSAFTKLKSDASGNGIPASSTDAYGAICLEAALAAAELVQVYVVVGAKA